MGLRLLMVVALASFSVDCLNNSISSEAARACRNEGQGNGNRVSICLKTRVTVNNFFLLKTLSPAYVQDEFWIQDYWVTKLQVSIN